MNKNNFAQRIMENLILMPRKRLGKTAVLLENISFQKFSEGEMVSLRKSRTEGIIYHNVDLILFIYPAKFLFI